MWKKWLVLSLLVALWSTAVFGGGFYVGTIKSNELQELADRYPFVNDSRGGFLRDKDRMVLFGILATMNTDQKKITVSARTKQFRVTLTPKTILIENSKTISSAEKGDWVAVDMLYSKPFMADKIYFSQYRQYK